MTVLALTIFVSTALVCFFLLLFVVARLLALLAPPAPLGEPGPAGVRP